MLRIAVKMLLGDKAKYFGLIFGVAFATILISQQVSIFIGVMARTSNFILAITEPDIWVMDPHVMYIDEIENMREIELSRVRSVEGIKWAVPFYKGTALMHLPDNSMRAVQVIGVDQTTMIGNCPNFLMGDPQSVQKPDSVMLDAVGYENLWPGQPMKVGQNIELNEYRFKIEAVCDILPGFVTFPTVFTSYKAAQKTTPQSRKTLPFILVKAADGVDVSTLKERIIKETGTKALTRMEFIWGTINYYLENTGIAINFGITIMLGIIIGASIAAQTFYIFVVENLKQFAAMKAIGVTNRQLLQMVWTQAGIVGLIGYCIGIGFTAIFSKVTENITSFRGIYMYGEVMAGTAAIIVVVILLSTIFSLRKVFRIDPATVFR